MKNIKQRLNYLSVRLQKKRELLNSQKPSKEYLDALKDNHDCVKTEQEKCILNSK